MSSPSEAVRRPAAPRPDELTRSEHDRIERLFGALDDISRYLPDLPGPAVAGQLGQAWARISDLLLAHADAEERLYALGMAGQDPPGPRARRLVDLDRIRAAVAQAAGHRAGSADWWRAVHAARLAAGRHIRLARPG